MPLFSKMGRKQAFLSSIPSIKALLMICEMPGTPAIYAGYQ
jgi:hypothetical protein